MHAENFIVNQSSHRHVVKTIRKLFPNLDVVSPLAFIIEPINSVDCRAFMVATQKEEIFWILNFIGEEKTDCFDRLTSSVHVVAQEKVVGKWRLFSVFKYSQQIVVLAVNVAHYFQGGF